MTYIFCARFTWKELGQLGALNVQWWRHKMETFSALLAICAGNSPVPGEFPAQRPVAWGFMFFFICARINGWVNTLEAGDLRLHPVDCDAIVMFCIQWLSGVLMNPGIIKSDCFLRITTCFYLVNLPKYLPSLFCCSFFNSFFLKVNYCL